ncbi:MAG: formate/nitrite transporter family protein [Candidatus Zixiibacteriota bacterium]|nr:MAG: formate/nitrite transporter family protein [candidate division Zixibacteria bacterium]
MPEKHPSAEDRDSPLKDVSSRELREIDRLIAPNARIIYEAIRRAGEEEIQRSASGLAWSGLAAGMSMGFSLISMGLLQAHIPESTWQPLLVRLGYSVGFLIIVLGRQQLFTETTLTAILPLLARPQRDMFLAVIKLWGTVLGANLLGAFAFALIIENTDIFAPTYHRAFELLAWEQYTGSWISIFIRGIFAGWLIALMVWLLPASGDSRFWVIIVITYLVALANFTHIIAGSVEVLFLVASGSLSLWQYLGNYMIPTLLGNILGGTSIVAALNHAQVVAGNQNRT